MPTRNYIEEYVAFLKGFADVARPLRVAFDFSNGPTALIVPSLIAKIPAIVPRYVDRTISGNFPAHGPNPLAEKALEHLTREVFIHHADLGVIFDADGDRAFFMDQRGRPMPGYLAAHLLSLHESAPFVFDTRTMLSLSLAGLLNPALTVKSRVGSYFVKAAMRESKAGFGAEYSGHYYFKSFFGADSGIVAAMKVMNALSRLPYSLADFVDLAPNRVATHEENVATEDPARYVASLVAQFRREAKKVTSFDGTTLDFGSWTLMARPSNTEPMARLFIASTNRAALERARARLVAHAAR